MDIQELKKRRDSYERNLAMYEDYKETAIANKNTEALPYYRLRIKDYSRKLREVNKQINELRHIEDFREGVEVAFDDIDFFGLEWVLDVLTKDVVISDAYDWGYMELVDRVKGAFA